MKWSLSSPLQSPTFVHNPYTGMLVPNIHQAMKAISSNWNLSSPGPIIALSLLDYSACCQHKINMVLHLLRLPIQHGFQRGYSTVTNLLEFTNFLAESLNERRNLPTIYKGSFKGPLLGMLCSLRNLLLWVCITCSLMVEALPK